MFFPRLRRHAKWVFLFLAVAFGLGFVGFGVGAGGIGFGDVLRGTGGGSGVPSASDAQKRIDENPKDAKAYRDLATALQADGETDGAIEALESFVALRPKDVAALRDLAGLYFTQATDAQRRAQLAELRASYLATGATVAGFVQLGGKPLDVDPISSAVSSVISRDSSAAFADAQEAAGKYIDTYKKIAAASPSKADGQLELAQAAQDIGDLSTAIVAYGTFLDLAPGDPNAADVRRVLKQLRAQAGPTG